MSSEYQSSTTGPKGIIFSHPIVLTHFFFCMGVDHAECRGCGQGFSDHNYEPGQQPDATEIDGLMTKLLCLHCFCRRFPHHLCRIGLKTRRSLPFVYQRPLHIPLFDAEIHPGRPRRQLMEESLCRLSRGSSRGQERREVPGSTRQPRQEQCETGTQQTL